MSDDLSLPHRYDPGHPVVRLHSAADPAHGAPTDDYDMVADGLRRVSVGAHLLPDLGDFLEVVSNAGVAGVAAALDERAREWEKLDVGVVDLEQRVDVA